MRIAAKDARLAPGQTTFAGRATAVPERRAIRTKAFPAPRAQSVFPPASERRDRNLGERAIWYFDAPGKQNTARTLEAALERAKVGDVPFIVVASSSGETGLCLVERAKETGYAGQVVVCTYHAGFSGGDAVSLPPERRARLESMGARVVMGSHALSGVSRSFRQRFGGLSLPEIIAESYRRISEGFKVAVEVAIMAADAGAVPAAEDVISIGGEGKGADTALLLRPCHQNSFFDLKVREILCMPRGK